MSGIAPLDLPNPREPLHDARHRRASLEQDDLTALLAKLEEYFATTSFDKILQGAAVCDGDAYAYPNAMQRAMRVDTFEPSDTDTPRTAVAGALVAAAGRTAGIELTVSSGKAKTPPSLDEWAAVLDELSALA